MNIDNKLDTLLFGKENNKRENFNTESVYASLDIINNPNKYTIEQYIIPNNDTNKNTLNYEKISDLSIKNKLLKINSTLKSFNIFLKNNQTKIQYDQLNSGMIDNFLSSDNNKNYFINFLLEFIIDLIWKVKEEGMQGNNLIEKITSFNIQKEEYEKKIRKLSAELEECKKEIKKIYNQNEIHKEKFDKNRKSVTSELTELKNENKKLNNMANLYKNEVKKKELEYARIQDKIKKILSAGPQNNSIFYKNQNFELSNDLEQSDYYKNLNQIVSEFNQEKYKLLINQNSYLFNILNHFQNFIERFCVKFNRFLEYMEGDSNKYFMNIISIKDNMFSFHLLENHLLENFYDNFITNLHKFDEMLKIITETAANCNIKASNNNSSIKSGNLEHFLNSKNSDAKMTMMLGISNIDLDKDKLMLMNKNDSDMLKNFKKWSLNTNNKSKWFQNLKTPKEINYEYDENAVIKGISDDNTNDNMII